MKTYTRNYKPEMLYEENKVQKTNPGSVDFDDGLNDDFKPVSNEVLTDYRMVVFNRRGNLLFESYEPDNGWDGSCPSGPCQPGVYNWKITYIVQQNNEFVTVDKKGTVVLLK